MKIIINQKRKLKNLRKKMSKMTYELDNIWLVPARISNIKHRSECNVLNADCKLPIFTAPMNSVINEHNYEEFINYDINTIIPRGVDYNVRKTLCTKTFVAMSLVEFADFVESHQVTDTVYYICVDIANGHMKSLIDLCAAAKEKFAHNLVLMAGNIANPDTYVEYALAGIDFVRCGIGGGNVCTTTNRTGIHYGTASLIKEVADKKYTIEQCIANANILNIPCKYKSVPFIVADGGIDSNDKIIKSLALGADFVMCGRIFAQSEEACGAAFWEYPKNPEMLTDKDKARLVYHQPVCEYGFHLREYYGMSTHRAQKETGRHILAVEEGINTYVDILYSLEEWKTDFVAALQSCMSYVNATNLEQFKNTNFIIH